jgi:hypothetical protein
MLYSLLVQAITHLIRIFNYHINKNNIISLLIKIYHTICRITFITLKYVHLGNNLKGFIKN